MLRALVWTLCVSVGVALPTQGPDYALIPGEDSPMTFATVQVQANAELEATQPSPAAQPSAAAAANVNTFTSVASTIVETRAHSFASSLPHVAHANCHVSRVRQLGECSQQCRGHGVCGAGLPGDNPGQCWCTGPWAGDDCMQRLTPAEAERKWASLFRVNATAALMPAEQNTVKLYEYPKMKYCYFSASTQSFFDLTAYDEPVPQLETTMQLHQLIVKNPKFVEKPINSSFLELSQDDVPPPPPPPEEEDIAPPTPAMLSNNTKTKGPEVQEGEAVDVSLFGQLGSYHTPSCAVWRRLGPGFQNVQGFTFEPQMGVFPGFDLSVEISGRLFCSDVARVGTGATGRGAATLKWMLVHSIDGSNVNYRTLDQGETRVVDGQCAGMGLYEGIPIHGDVPRMTGGFVGLWLSVEFEGPENGSDYVTVCDDFKYVMTKGPQKSIAIPPASATKDDDDDDCEDCNNNRSPGDDTVVHLSLQRVPASQ